MAVEQHRHDEDGNVILLEQESPEDAEAKAMARAAEVQAEAQVEMARIEADAQVAIAKMETKSVDEDLATQLAAALAELEALKAANAPEPEPEVVPVVVDSAPAPEPEPGPEDLPPTDHSEHSERPRKKPLGIGMW